MVHGENISPLQVIVKKLHVIQNLLKMILLYAIYMKFVLKSYVKLIDCVFY